MEEDMTPAKYYVRIILKERQANQYAQKCVPMRAVLLSDMGCQYRE